MAEESMIDPPGVEGDRCKVRNKYSEETELENAYPNAGPLSGTMETLLKKRKFVSILSLIVGMLGIFLMIIESELTARSIIFKGSFSSFGLKALISISTILLLGLVIAFNILDMKIIAMKKHELDWKSEMKCKRIAKIVMEVVVCLIHPPPINYNFIWTVKMNTHGGFMKTERVSIDVPLSIFMFLRFYLLWRVMLLYTRVFTEMNLKPTGEAHDTTLNGRSFLKALMMKQTVKTLLVCVPSIWVIASWSLSQCERYHDINATLGNSMWITARILFNLGDGGSSVNTICGNGILLGFGFIGTLCTAVIIAVVLRAQVTAAKQNSQTLMDEAQLLEQNPEREPLLDMILKQNQIGERLKMLEANVLETHDLVKNLTTLIKQSLPSRVEMHIQKDP